MQGNIPRSQDLSAAVMLLASLFLLWMFGQRMLSVMHRMLQVALSGNMADPLTGTDELAKTWMALLMMGVGAAGPVILGVLIAGILVNFWQVGLLMTLKTIKPSLSKLSPLKGIQNIFSLRGGVRLLMSIGKVAIVGTVAAICLHGDLPKVGALAGQDPNTALAAAATLVFWLALKIAIVLLILAILDYAYQKWQHEEDLKMSKQEVKDEMRSMEGDPEVKRRRFAVAQQLVMQRVQQAVPNADVVVTNPTHFAVALRYDGETMNAPKVVAKGADFLALRIRQIAAANGVPIVERKELARALYRYVEVGQEVPPEHYAAVAEILAYVYRLSGRRSA